MTTSVGKRTVFSMTALSVALSATLIVSSAMAEHNESYRMVNKGWLAEYDGPSTGTQTTSNDRYRSVFGDNDTYGFIHDGYLSEYAYKPGDPVYAGGAVKGTMQFGQLDKDGNGVITKQEAAQDTTLSAKLMGADRDASGHLDEAEFSAFETMTPGKVIHRFERRLDWLGTGYWD